MVPFSSADKGEYNDLSQRCILHMRYGQQTGLS
jgi:hypothetical protein